MWIRAGCKQGPGQGRHLLQRTRLLVLAVCVALSGIAFALRWDATPAVLQKMQMAGDEGDDSVARWRVVEGC